MIYLKGNVMQREIKKGKGKEKDSFHLLIHSHVAAVTTTWPRPCFLEFHGPGPSLNSGPAHDPLMPLLEVTATSYSRVSLLHQPHLPFGALLEK